jgi:hypothetical protein
MAATKKPAKKMVKNLPPQKDVKGGEGRRNRPGSM